MIYCVIPTELADELYDRLVEHYRANPNVQVIIDRRSEDRRAGEDVDAETSERRLTRDRRRARPGTFPALHDPSA
ncbi:MAG: hypothetical protein JWL76_1132 [Thermoleophilia bacterium]|nr:hypothetical protein [Thermoleophilia bacterium]